MKKSLIITATCIAFTATTLSADGFTKRYDMMESRIKTKMEKFASNQEAQKFLKTKLECVKASKTEADLKNCKKKYHPKDLKKILNK